MGYNSEWRDLAQNISRVSLFVCLKKMLSISMCKILFIYLIDAVLKNIFRVHRAEPCETHDHLLGVNVA